MYDVVVIGGGPAGLSAALKNYQNNLKVLVLEREAKLGGILKQCIHDGFGVIRYQEKLTGPEYANRDINQLKSTDIKIELLSFVFKIEEKDNIYTIYYINRNGLNIIQTESIILATGCKERTRNQIIIPGDRGVGVYTAGTVQHLVNLLGINLGKKAVILGSGDIGLIMARRLTLEGVDVIGVYELKSTPSGLPRNINQCLNDYDIPLYLSHTITKIIGKDRVEAVEIAQVDSNLMEIESTKTIIKCDLVVLAVGLIPENEISEMLGVEIDPCTKGPFVDQRLMTKKLNIFACGNCLHVHDLVDYVSEGASIAGDILQRGNKLRKLIDIKVDEHFLYLVPQMLDINEDLKVIFYFRSKEILYNLTLVLTVNNIKVFEKKYQILNPPEMERLEIDMNKFNINETSEILFTIEVKK